jgi:GT2 family glycosyltransferase
LALSSYVDTDRRRLERHGWRVRPGFELSRDLDSYRDYIVGSRGEFTVAKDQNVRLRTGWFSERTATYLAAGRPVVVQDTGFGNAIPTGVGLLPFTSVEEAAAAIEAVNGDYERHRRAAIDVARQYFNYDVVLGRMLDHVGLANPSLPTRRSRPAAPAVPLDLPRSLRLTPRSRRPLELPRETVAQVLARPIPSAGRSPSDHPTASVVVVTFDNLVLTRMTIESLLANTARPPYEIVVVDNGSTDGTRGYLSVLAARNPHVRLVRNKANRGFAAAANQGMAVARADILVLLNNDTIVPPGWLSDLASHLGDAAVGLVGPVTNRCGNEAEVKVDYETYGDLLEVAEQRRHAAAARAFELPVAEMFCVALRRDVLERVGALDERYEIGMFEDDDYSRRVRDAGFRVMCAEDVFVHHFGEASLGRLTASGRYAEVFETNRRRFEEKWGVRWEAHRRRPDPEYDAVRRRVREAVRRLVPAGSVVLVISKGDDSLLDLPGLAARHFPRMADGQYAGHHPADDEDAITQLEAERGRGAGYLVVPAPSMWWLDHYQGFARHLERRHRQSAAAAETAVIFELDGSGAMVPGASHVAGGSQ